MLLDQFTTFPEELPHFKSKRLFLAGKMAVLERIPIALGSAGAFAPVHSAPFATRYGWRSAWYTRTGPRSASR